MTSITTIPVTPEGFHFCRTCGAAIPTQLNIDAIGLHNKWHEDQEYEVNTLRRLLRHLSVQVDGGVRA